MCGIVGVMSPESKVKLDAYERRLFFTQALYADALRGMDSTGYFAIDEDATLFTHKRALSSADFLQLAVTAKHIGDMNKFPIMVGHNRAATHGSVTDNNAHPFRVGNVCMVHNGTLTNHNRLAKGFDVDSEALASFLSENENDLQKVVDEVKGAYAIVWYNRETEKFRMLRNEERPLAIGTMAGGTKLFASEKSMVQWLCDRQRTPIVLESLIDIEPYTVYEWDINDLSKMEVKKLEAPKKSVSDYSYSYTKSYNQDARREEKHAEASRPIDFTTARNERMQKELLRLGFHLGQIVTCVPSYFVAYDKDAADGLGCSNGYVDQDNYVDVVIPNMSLATHTKAVEDGSYEGRVIGMFYEHKDYPIVRLEHVTATEAEELKKEEELQEFKGPFGHAVTEKELEALIADGCDNCTGPVYKSDHKNLLWTFHRKPICPACAADYAEWGISGHLH